MSLSSRVSGSWSIVGHAAGFGRRFAAQLRITTVDMGFTVIQIVHALQQRVVLEHLLQFLVQLKRGQLQQTDRLLQLWRQRKVL